MEWFGGNYEKYSFISFSLSHWIMIGIFITGAIILFLWRKNLRQRNLRKLEILLALSLLLFEISYHLWAMNIGIWHISDSLPLELCSFSLFLTAALLLTKKRLIFEIVFFTSLLGASQAIATPVLDFGFPHFRFWHYFYTHLVIIWIALYFVWVKDYYPTIWSVLKVFIFLNILLPIILFINKLVDGNYMFLNYKPVGGSLLDYLGPHPWYILSLEGLLIGLSIITWLIFRNWRHKQPENYLTNHRGKTR
ncbi:TIGR02206 family membrane protein [Bacillus kwashiorkori]|uniref:YwaF family protein n=1 Tax=Bacillus kwashiorkori TaxID=1522318 RepID=UPI000781A27E|nr:TIGR02206 family membrane protein [Bacillus kwashiorkori]